MPNVTMPRTGRNPLSFSGELLAEAGGKPDWKGRSRWHAVTIHRLEHGATRGYVLAVNYQSEWPGESGYSDAVLLQSPAEVMDWLRTYDPLAHYIGYPPSPQYAAKDAQQRQRIVSAWQVTVSEILKGEEFAERIGA